LRRNLHGISVAEPEGSAAHYRQNANQLPQVLDVLEGYERQVRHEGHNVYVDSAREVASSVAITVGIVSQQSDRGD